MELNEAQRQAVEHGEGPLLVVAGAGSGKTGTLAHRVAHLVGRGADPARVLLLTFSRRAAHEMIRRAQRVLDEQAAQARAAGDRHAAAAAGGAALGLGWSGTFHA